MENAAPKAPSGTPGRLIHAANNDTACGGGFGFPRIPPPSSALLQELSGGLYGGEGVDLLHPAGIILFLTKTAESSQASSADQGIHDAE